MKIEILGCSGGVGLGLKTTTFLLDEQLLIDAGTGIELLTMERMLNIRDIVITHAHLDHTIGLPLMLATIFDQHKTPVNVYAIPEVIQALKDHVFNWTVWPDLTQLPQEAPILNLHEINLGDQLSIQGKTITVLPAEHPTPTVGYFVDDGQHSFAFTGDNGINDQLWPILNTLKPELLIIDVSFTDEVDALARVSGHLTPSHLEGELKKFDHDANIMITHLKPGFEVQIMEECRALIPERNIQKLQHNQIIDLNNLV